jgi:adrenodoxin-NADP+ reductase
VLTYGAEGDRKLNIRGEDLKGVLSARSFVNWFNGHPEYSHLSEDILAALDRNPNVVVIGQGNVALDCARILAKAGTCKVLDNDNHDATSGLGETDITDHCLKTLEKVRGNGTGVKLVNVVGRRGAAQASFTIKELRELTKIDGVKLSVDAQELEMSNTEASQQEVKTNRPKQRISTLINQVAASDDKSKEIPEVALRFLLTPEEIKADPTNSYATSVILRRSSLSGPAGSQQAVLTDEKIELPAGLVLSAVGWQSLQADDSLPFDHEKCVIPTNHARVEGVKDNDDGAPLYAAGWIKRGPTGIIGSNISDAREAAAAVLDDTASIIISPNRGHEALLNLVEERGEVSDWTGWLEMDQVEVATGNAKGKSREKLISVEEMIKIANSDREDN